MEDKIKANVSPDAAPATETKKGIIRIATEEEAIEGVNDKAAITPKTLNDVMETLPTVNDAEIEIQKNGTKAGSFSTNQGGDKQVINITVPTSAPDVGALPDSTKYGSSIDLNVNTTTFVITATLKDQDGTTLSTGTVDLPLESVVVSGSYDDSTKKVVLTLQGGSTVEFSVADLVNGLQSEITSSNKLSADLIADGTTNKTVNQTEKDSWNGKQDSISDLSTIRSGASAGATAVQPEDLSTVATSGDYDDLLNKPSIPSAQVQSDWSQSDNLAVDYIKNKPTIPDAQIQSDWNQTNTTAKDYIKNKPTLFSGSYNDLTDKPTIPTVPTDVSAFNNDAGYTTNAGTITGVIMNGVNKGTSGVVDLGTVLTQHQDISGKVNISDIASSVSASSTNSVPVGAKLFYDTCGNLETILHNINSGT